VIPTRALLLAAGWLAMLLGLLGVFLPLLPTTPFLLLAAACFLRSSPAMHARLMAHPRLGPFLAQWRRDHSIPRSAKRRAYVLVVVCFALSIGLAGALTVRIALGVLMVALLVFLARLRTTP
jgi:uncharacterized membrane protein YbaN (DUF454 family)